VFFLHNKHEGAASASFLGSIFVRESKMEEPTGEGPPPSLQDLDDESFSSDSEETSSAESSSDSEQSMLEGLQSVNAPLAAQIKVAPEARPKRGPPKRSTTASSNSKKRRIEQPPSLSDTLGKISKINKFSLNHPHINLMLSKERWRNHSCSK